MHLVAIILMMIYGVPHEGGYSMDEPFLFKFELWFESADQYVTKLRVEWAISGLTLTFEAPLRW